VRLSGLMNETQSESNATYHVKDNNLGNLSDSSGFGEGLLI